MPTDAQRLLIHRRELGRTRLVPDPDAPAARPLAEGEARLAIERFAVTANNITYAAFGEAMKYWQFFPAPEADRAEWACLPVWGFATVVESRAEGVAPGRRVWAYLPAGSHLVVRPERVRPAGFVDGAPHRQGLAAIYNQLAFCDADPAWRPDAESEGLQAVLKPLFMTAFLLDDFLAEQDFFGARQLLLTSASSKTAFATAFCLHRRARGQPGDTGASRPEIVGLTSPANRGFTAGLGCYDRVLAYDELGTLDAATPAVLVDFAGNAALRRRVHEQFGERLMHSASIGGTHWQALGGGGGLPGPRPTLFFAPAQAQKRAAPPPEGWGAAGLQQRLGEAWTAFVERVRVPGAAWVALDERAGAAAIDAAYHAMLDGRVDARQGLVLRP